MRFFRFSTPADDPLYTGLDPTVIEGLRRFRPVSHTIPRLLYTIPASDATKYLFWRTNGDYEPPANLQHTTTTTITEMEVGGSPAIPEQPPSETYTPVRGVYALLGHLWQTDFTNGVDNAYDWTPVGEVSRQLNGDIAFTGNAVRGVDIDISPLAIGEEYIWEFDAQFIDHADDVLTWMFSVTIGGVTGGIELRHVGSNNDFFYEAGGTSDTKFFTLSDTQLAQRLRYIFTFRRDDEDDFQIRGFAIDSSGNVVGSGSAVLVITAYASFPVTSWRLGGSDNAAECFTGLMGNVRFAKTTKNYTDDELTAGINWFEVGEINRTYAGDVIASAANYWQEGITNDISTGPAFTNNDVEVYYDGSWKWDFFTTNDQYVEFTRAMPAGTGIIFMARGRREADEIRAGIFSVANSDASGRVEFAWDPEDDFGIRVIGLTASDLVNEFSTTDAIATSELLYICELRRTVGNNYTARVSVYDEENGTTIGTRTQSFVTGDLSGNLRFVIGKAFGSDRGSWDSYIRDIIILEDEHARSEAGFKALRPEQFHSEHYTSTASGSPETYTWRGEVLAAFGQSWQDSIEDDTGNFDIDNMGGVGLNEDSELVFTGEGSQQSLHFNTSGLARVNEGFFCSLKATRGADNTIPGLFGMGRSGFSDFLMFYCNSGQLAFTDGTNITNATQTITEAQWQSELLYNFSVRRNIQSNNYDVQCKVYDGVTELASLSATYRIPGSSGSFTNSQTVTIFVGGANVIGNETLTWNGTIKDVVILKTFREDIDKWEASDFYSVGRQTRHFAPSVIVAAGHHFNDDVSSAVPATVENFGNVVQTHDGSFRFQTSEGNQYIHTELELQVGEVMTTMCRARRGEDQTYPGIFYFWDGENIPTGLSSQKRSYLFYYPGASGGAFGLSLAFHPPFDNAANVALDGREELVYIMEAEKISSTQFRNRAVVKRPDGEVLFDSGLHTGDVAGNNDNYTISISSPQVGSDTFNWDAWIKDWIVLKTNAANPNLDEVVPEDFYEETNISTFAEADPPTPAVPAVPGTIEEITITEAVSGTASYDSRVMVAVGFDFQSGIGNTAGNPITNYGGAVLDGTAIRFAEGQYLQVQTARIDGAMTVMCRAVLESGTDFPTLFSVRESGTTNDVRLRYEGNVLRIVAGSNASPALVISDSGTEKLYRMTIVDNDDGTYTATAYVDTDTISLTFAGSFSTNLFITASAGFLSDNNSWTGTISEFLAGAGELDGLPTDYVVSNDRGSNVVVIDGVEWGQAGFGYADVTAGADIEIYNANLSGLVCVEQIGRLEAFPQVKGKIRPKPKIFSAINKNRFRETYPDKLLLRLNMRGQPEADIALLEELYGLNAFWTWTSGGNESGTAEWAEIDVFRPCIITRHDGLDGVAGKAIGGGFGVVEISETSREVSEVASLDPFLADDEPLLISSNREYLTTENYESLAYDDV